MAGVYRGDHLVYVGNVGTGYGADKVARLMPALKAAASETNPFGGNDAPRKKAGMHWLKPNWGGDRVCGVHRLRHDPAGRVQGINLEAERCVL
jgi:ATP dependent DNA ligase C terminal region